MERSPEMQQIYDNIKKEVKTEVLEKYADEEKKADAERLKKESDPFQIKLNKYKK